jgi:hypothetical protein
MIRASIGIALAAVAGTAPAAAAVRSVFIGINSYDTRPGDKDAPKALAGPVNDVAIIKAALAQYYTVDTGPPLVGDDCRAEGPMAITLVNKCATRDAIRQAINGQIAAAASGDQIIIYFAGHGSFVANAERRAGQDRRNSTILPYDARADVPRDIYDVELRDQLYTANARGVSVITIFDSCSSGTATRDLRSGTETRDAPTLAIPAPADAGSVVPAPVDGAYLVHFAAVADDGVAVEARFGPQDGLAAAEQTNGVFTRALALALAQNPGRSTYRDIAERTRWLMARLGAAAPPTLDAAPPGALANGQRLAGPAPEKLRFQGSQAEGALDTVFIGGGAPSARVYPAVAAGTETVATTSDGLLAGVTRGSRFSVHCSIADAGAARGALAGDAVVTRVTATSAQLQMSAPLQGCAGAKQLGVREIHHSYGGLKLAIGLSGNPTSAETKLFADALDGADALIRDDAAAPYQVRIETGSDRCDPDAGQRTGAFRAAADGRLIKCLGATDSPVFERRLGEIVRAAANYHAVVALAAEPTATLAKVTLREPDCTSGDSGCTFVTGSNNRVPAGGGIAVDVTATDSAVHAYALLLDGRNFRIEPLNGADNATDAQIALGATRRLFEGNFGVAGELGLLVLVTPTPLSLAALRQQPVRAINGREPSALEHLLASAGQGQRAVPAPAPEAWDARLTRFTIGDQR